MRKKLQVTAQRVIDPASEKERGTWYEYLTEEPEESVAQKKGSMYGLAAIKGRWGIKGDELISFFFSNFKEFYYQNPENQVTKNLEESVTFAHKKLVSQLSGEDGTNTFFNFIVFILWGNVLYVAQVGKAKAILVRGEEAETIGSHLVDNLKEELFGNTIHIASGLIKKEDVLVLGMPEFWKHLDISKLKVWLQRLSLEELEKKLLKTYEEDNIGQSLFLKFSVGIYPSEEEVINITIPTEEQKNERMGEMTAKLVGVKDKIQEMFKRKPLTVTLTDKPQAPSQKFTKEEFEEVKKEEGLDQEVVPVESEQPVIETSENNEIKPRTLKPQNPSRLWETKDAAGGIFQRSWKKIQTRINLVKAQVSQARQDAAKSREVRKNSDPSTYINRKWWTQLFARRGWIVVILLAVLLMGSVYLTNYVRQNNNIQSEYDQTYTDIIAKIEEVQRISFTVPERQEVYQEGRDVLSSLESVSYDNDKLNTLRDTLQSLRDTVYNIVRINEPTIITDISLKADNAQAQELALIDDQLYLLDDENNTLYSVPTTQNELSLTSLTGNDWKLLLGNEGDLYGYSSEGIGRYNGTGFDTILDKNEQWQSVKDMSDYYGNIYLLDPQASQVWKYTAFGNDFSSMVGYLTTPPDATFTQAVSLSVDGAIYVLLDDGQIWKFLLGQRTEYVVQSLDVAFNNPTHIYTREESNMVYILDAGNRRIVLLDKQGNYKKQYTSDDWGSLSDFAINADETKMYVLNGTQVLEIPLENAE